MKPLRLPWPRIVHRDLAFFRGGKALAGDLQH
jgi:hypothetical protein